MSNTRSYAHIQVSLSSSSSTISLGSSPPSSDPFQLIVTARIIDSSMPDSATTLCTDGSPLDNGQHERHDGLFRGAFMALQSIKDPHRTICLAFIGTPNYGSQPDASVDLRERPWMRFETVPAVGRGELVIKHDLSLQRLFRYSRLQANDVKPGERFRLRVNPKRLYSEWWAFGDMSDDAGDGGLAGKKFAKWELPDEHGEVGNLMPGEQPPDVEKMESEGWVFCPGLRDLEMTAEDMESGIVIEFTEQNVS